MRFQPKLRRRRQCKTDYAARKVLIVQDKNKYNTPKFRFVVRITNKDVVCQVVSAKMIGDEVKCVAYSHELKRYGVDVGLTNWAACYATGLLCARRLLKKLKLDEHYVGCEEATGDFFENEAEEGDDEEDVPNPFQAFLDVGLRRTTTGSRVFAAMKGAVDGGLDVPYGDSGKQFPGYAMGDEGEPEFDSDRCRQYIFGGHVAEYMRKLKEDNPEKFEKQFSRFVQKGLDADDLEEMYEKCHAAIRANPEGLPKKQSDVKVSKYVKKPKLTYAERKDHVMNKILSIKRKAMQKA